MRLNDRFFRALVLLNTAVLAAMALVAVFILVRQRAQVHDALRGLLDREIATGRFLAGFRQAPGVPEQIDYPHYAIELALSDLRRIQVQIQEMLDAGIMMDQHKIWYPAKFRYGDDEYDVKIRLRGDFPNHWAGEKKSWRVRFKKGRLFQGRREIDFIIPSDRSYEVEVVAFRAARDLGLLVSDAGFCNLRINGIDFGAYVWMEKYGPEMLEKQSYPVGEIFRHQNIWTQTRRSGFGIWAEQLTATYETEIHRDANAGFYARRWDDLTRLVQEADDDTFRREIPELLNLEKFLAWNALTWLFGSDHSHGADNLRWYYDDSTGLFEPILYDVQRYPIQLAPARPGGLPRWAFEERESNLLVTRVISIPEHRQRRNEVLWRLLTDERFDMAAASDAYFRQLRGRFLAGAGAVDSPVVDRVHAETHRILNNNRSDLRRQLEFARMFVAPVLSWRNSKPTVLLRLVPDCRSFVQLDSLAISMAPSMAAALNSDSVRGFLVDPEGRRRSVAALRVASRGDSDIVIAFDDLVVWTPVDPKLRQVAAEWVLEVEFDAVSSDAWRRPGIVTAVRGSFRNTVSSASIEEPFVISSPVIYRHLEEPTTQPGDGLGDSTVPSALPLEDAGDRFVLRRGTYRLMEDLVLPRGHGLELEPGVRLRMGPGVSVVVRGPLTVRGTKSEPVWIEPDSDGAPWGSFAVVRAGAPSRVQHLTVRGGSEDRIAGLNLSGQLCFYRSDLILEDSTIAGARADDGLNVKNGSVEVRRCRFLENAVDGFDGDWVTGTVEASVFLNNGGDGLDFSGADVAVQDCLFQGMGDKAISIGEKSGVLVFNVVLRDSLIGVACKDSSRVDVHASVFLQNKTGAALYRKKQLFGGSTGQVVGSLFWANARNLEVDTESTVAVLSSAADHWETQDGVTATGVIEGKPESFYYLRADGLVLHEAGRREGSPFTIEASTPLAGRSGLEAPDMKGLTSGLVQPFTVPEP